MESRKFPRQVCLFQNKRTIITYSDGEGSSAGIGIGLWIQGRSKPLAAFTKCPREVRLLWAKQQHTSTSTTHHLTDIFQIEAVGPLAVLATWPNLLRDCLWIHFIDNVAALSALVNGSSSVSSGDVVIGLTWEMIASRCISPWFDRVDSKSNPVDGLSRGRRQGPWSVVQEALLPGRLLQLLRRLQY